MKSYIYRLIEYIEGNTPMNNSEMRIWYKALKLREEEAIEEREARLFKYRLIVSEGEYFANSLLALLWDLFRHRLSRLAKKVKWKE